MEIHQVRFLFAQALPERLGVQCRTQVFQPGDEQRNAVPQVDGALLVEFPQRPHRTEQQHYGKRCHNQRQDYPGHHLSAEAGHLFMIHFSALW